MEALNDSLDNNEEVNPNESKDIFKDIESHPAYSFLSYQENKKRRLEETAIRHFNILSSLDELIYVFS